MTSRKLAALVLFAAIVAGAWLSLRFVGDLRDRARRIEVAKETSAAAATRLTLLSKRMTTRTSSTVNAAISPPRKSVSHQGELMEQLGSDPALQNRYLAYQRSGLVMKYGALFARLGLTARQISECEDNLMKRQEVYLDLEDIARRQDQSQNEQAAMEQSLLAPYRAAQLALLGEDGMKQLDTFDQGFHSQAMIEGYAGAATVAGIALTPQQMQELSGVVLQESQTAPTHASSTSSQDLWAAVDIRAASFLTPAQQSLMKTGEFLGPFGEGSRFQNLLNNAITLADQADMNAAHPR